MKMNTIEIQKDKELKTKLYLNGNEINKVIDFSYKKTSANIGTEVTIIIDVDEIYESFK